MFLVAAAPAGPAPVYQRMAEELETAAAAIEKMPAFDRELVERLRNLVRSLREGSIVPECSKS